MLPLQLHVAAVAHAQPCSSRVYSMYTWLSRTIVLSGSLGQCMVRPGVWACRVEE